MGQREEQYLSFRSLDTLVVVSRSKEFESLETFCTLIWSLSSMDSHVGLELMLLGDLFPTQCTLEIKGLNSDLKPTTHLIGLFSSVNSLVYLPVVVLYESLATEAAEEGELLVVLPLVSVSVTLQVEGLA